MLQDTNVERIIKEYTKSLRKRIDTLEIKMEKLRLEARKNTIKARDNSRILRLYNKYITDGEEL